MALRNAQTLESTNLVFHDKVSGNPFLGGPEGGALENFYYDHGKLVRISFMPPFQSSAAASSVWRTYQFIFTRDGAPETQLLIFKANGKIYKRSGGSEQEIFPASTGFNALVAKPAVETIRNRMLVSDGAQILFWDGWQWVAAGLAAPTGFDSTSTSVAGADGTLTTNGVYSIAITAVHIRSNGGTSVRIHESNRSGLANETPAATNHITVSVSGVTFPARATHWSIYMSELDGSAVYRRVTTLPITTTSYDILAEPSSTAPIAPERNDPIQPSRVLAVWKNRTAMRSETNKNQFWFTAFGEVNGLVNGAGEECVPGRLGSNTLSDLVNEWDIPDGSDIQSIIYHEDFLWVFTKRNGYLIRGEGALLDNRSLRDFFPQQQFNFGAAGPRATCSTPYGLIILSPEHKLWLWDHSNQVRDIGYDIQARLSTITDEDLFNVELHLWTGEGFDWLLVNLNDRIQVLDMRTRTEQSPDGTWFTIDNDIEPTSFCTYNIGKVYLLAGYADGSVHQVGDLCQPAHLGFTFILGSTYLGSSVQAHPDGVIQFLHAPSTTQWMIIKYIEGLWGFNPTTGAQITAPTTVAYYDAQNPTNPSSPHTITASQPGKTADVQIGYGRGFRYWFSKSSGSSVGIHCKHVQSKMTFGTDASGPVDNGRNSAAVEELTRISIVWQPIARLY